MALFHQFFSLRRRRLLKQFKQTCKSNTLNTKDNAKDRNQYYECFNSRVMDTASGPYTSKCSMLLAIENIQRNDSLVTFNRFISYEGTFAGFTII